MILADFEIKRLIMNKGLTPSLDRGDRVRLCDSHVQPSSLDVNLGTNFKFQGDEDWEDFDLEEGDSFDIQPGEFMLATTQRCYNIPNNIAAQLTGRSTLGRQGVTVHVTAGFIDPGFRGHITLEMHNVSKWPVSLAVGDRIGQLVFHKLSNECDEPYKGQYQNQYEATEAGKL